MAHAFFCCILKKINFDRPFLPTDGFWRDGHTGGRLFLFLIRRAHPVSSDVFGNYILIAREVWDRGFFTFYWKSWFYSLPPLPLLLSSLHCSLTPLPPFSFYHVFEPTCANARWALMSCFLSVCLWLDQNYWTIIHVARTLWVRVTKFGIVMSIDTV